LLDIALPKMNGWEMARQIHEECVWKRPLIVAEDHTHGAAEDPLPDPRRNGWWTGCCVRRRNVQGVQK
jgi:hypothetical protein